MNISPGIFCVGVDHHTTPLAMRESLVALAGPRLTPYLIEHGGADEVVYLSTCNRVEIYGRSGFRGPEIVEILRAAMPSPLGSAWREARGVYLYEGISCWRHLAEVATGLRSMVMGEGEILAQVREAYRGSRESGGTGKSLHTLFQSCLRAARAARREAGFGQGDPSVGRTAAESLAGLIEICRQDPLLILGAGHTARSFGMAARENGFTRFLVSSRTAERSSALAQDLGGQVVAWNSWHGAAKVCGVLASALSGGELAWECGPLVSGPHALVDLGVPRTLTRVRRSFPQAAWLDLEELAKRSELIPESLGSIHRAEEVLRAHERLWVLKDDKMKVLRGSAG